MENDAAACAGAAWLQNALGEHASVAAFARLVLHLMSLGAPPELLREAIRAMDDEVEHARLCFGLARKFSGIAAGPGKLDISDALAQPHDASAVLRGAILEGCLGETIAAREAAEAHVRTIDSSIRNALARIVPDETRHAELSWQLVTWIIQTFPELTILGESTFVNALAAPLVIDGGADFAAMEDYGLLTVETKRALRHATIANDITSRMIALFGRHPALHELGFFV